MNNYILTLLFFLIFGSGFAQTMPVDTAKVAEYIAKADELNAEKKYDEALGFLLQAQDMCSNNTSNKTYWTCELKKSLIYLGKNDLNRSLNMLNAGGQKVRALFGNNSDLYADFCDARGTVYLYAKKYIDAKKEWVNSLVIRKKVFKEKHYKLSVSYNNLGILYAETGEYLRSLKLYQKALKIREEVLPPNDLRIASALISTGNAYLKIDNPDFALKYFLKALAIQAGKAAPYEPRLVSFYINTGDTYKLSGMYEKALEYYDKGLNIIMRNQGENNPDAAQIYAKKAIVLNLAGNNGKALEFNNKALTIFKNTYGEEHRTVAKVMQNIGTDYLHADKITEAVKTFNSSLELYKKVYGTWSLETAEAYTNIGKIMEQNEEYNAASSYYSNALKIQRDVYKTDNHLEIAASFMHLADVYRGDDDYYPALDYYKKALAIIENKNGTKHAKTADIYYRMAKVYEAKRGYDAELKILQKALIANVENFYSDNINYNPDFKNSATFYYDEKLLFETLNAKAEAFAQLFLRSQNTEKLKKACEVYEMVDVVLNRLKNSLSGRKDSVYVQERAGAVYHKATGYCMQLYKKTKLPEYYNQAFVFAEKNKQNLSLSLPGAQKYAGLPKTFLEKEINTLIEKSYYRKKICENAKDAESKKQLQKLIAEHGALINRSKNEYPAYYDFKYKPFKTSVADIQNTLADSAVVFDYYAAQEAKYIYVFKIEKNKIGISFIPKDKAFDDKVLKFRNALLANTQVGVSVYAELGNTLYNQLIPGILPNDTLIKKLYIIPDGIIGTIPFEALLTEKYAGSMQAFKDYPFLLKKYAVIYAYSANCFEPEHLFYSRNYADTSFVHDWTGFAPVYASSNTNAPAKTTEKIIKKAEHSFGYNAPVSFLNGNLLVALPDTYKEIDSLYNQFLNRGKTALMKANELANKDFLRALEPKNSRYLHIAAYAFVNSLEAENSGFLAACDARAGKDGFIALNDMFSTPFNANLLVFSACQTGTQNFGRGEGMRAFLRGLFYGNTKNAVLSLWQTKGFSTSNLMLDFYKDILNNGENPEKIDVSLRNAKLKLIDEVLFAHPSYWSPFILFRK